MSTDFLPVARALYLNSVAATVMAGLAEAGIRSVLLKGASFRQLLYDADEVRRYTDVDLLISPADRAAAGRALEHLGYLDVFAGAAPSETSVFATEYRSTRAVIDLHRSLPGVTVPDADAWLALSRRTEAMALGRTSVEVLNQEARCLHVALDAAADGRARSKGDLRRAVVRLPHGVWREAARLAEELGAVPSLAAALDLVPEGADVRAAIGLRSHIPVGVALRAESPPMLSIGLHRLLTTPGARGKLAFLGRRLVPTPSGLRYWSPLARRGRAGMALAYAWRPFHLVWHSPAAAAALARAWKRSRAARPDP